MSDVMLEIETRSVVSPDVVHAQVAHALSLGLPDVALGPETDSVLTIYASGPSAADKCLRWPSMALNGALGLFGDDSPTFWAASDSQALVAAFLSKPCPYTRYMVASRCHPVVFEALRRANCLAVSLWHIADCAAPAGKDLMPDAPSVTIQALFLAYYLGFRKVVVHGWDCCLIGGKHHAVDQEHAGEFRAVRVGDKAFTTTLTWLAEAEDAVKAMAMLTGLDVTVTGPGMVAAFVAANKLQAA